MSPYQAAHHGVGLFVLRFRFASLLLNCAAAAILLCGRTAFGVDYVWNQNAAAGAKDWNTAANWTPAGPPMGGDGNNAHVGLGGTATITSAAGITPTIDSVLFDDVLGGTVNQSSDTLALAGTEVNADPAGQGRLRIGAVNAGAFGTYSLTGTGIVTATRIQVGESGSGADPVSTFNQGVLADAGATSVTTTESLNIGGAAGGTVGNGVYNINSGSLTVGIDTGGTNSLAIGNNLGSVGILNIKGGAVNGGTVSARRFQVGNGGTGTVNQGVVGDAGTTSVTTAQSLNIGGAAGGVVGTGTYTLNTGNLTVGSDGNRSLSVGNNVGSVGTMNINGGTVTSVGFQVGNGGTGTVNQTGGNTTFNQGPGNWSALGGSANGTSGGVGNGTYNLSGTGTMTVNNWLFIGVNNGNAGTSTGTFNISGPASVNLTSSWINLGRDTTGIFNQTGGTVDVTNRILIGDNLGTANGTYNMSGGTLNVHNNTNFEVGEKGTGTFNQTGGTVNANGYPLNIGATNNSTSNGTYILGGTGILNGTTDFNIGNGNSSTGLFTQSGGTLSQTSGRFGMAGGTGSSANYNISGGTATIGNAWVAQGNNSTAAINQTGGTLNVGGDNALVLGWGGGTAAATYTLSGASSGPNAVVLNAGVLANNNPSIQIGWNGNAVFNQNGGVVNAMRAGVAFGGFGGGTKVGVYNLSGGILNTARVYKQNGAANATFNFNGGTLSPTASAANFLQGLDTANVQGSGAVSGSGAVFDTNGSAITVAQTLLNGVAGTDGGLTLTDSNVATAGSLTLTAANTYNGTTRVINTAGAIGPSTLFLGNALAVQNSTVQMTAGINNSVQFNGGIGAFTFGGLSGSANLSLTDLGPAAVTLSVGNNNSDTTYSGKLGTAADGASLVKIGTGTLHLTNTQLYTGATTINGGTLSLNGASASLANSSSVDVGGAAASGAPTLLAKSGANAGAVHVHSAEITGAAGTIAAGDFDVFQAASIKMDAGSNAAFVLGAPGTGDLISVLPGGALTLPATGAVTVSFTDGGGLALGTYKLFTAPTISNFSPNALLVGNSPLLADYHFTEVGTTEIDVTAVAAKSWTGGAGTGPGGPNLWETPANWLGGTPASIPGDTSGALNNGDTAFFVNAGNTETTIRIDLNRNVKGLTFSSAAAAAYTIGDAGPGLGNPLLLTAGGIIQTGQSVTATQTINAPLVLEGASASYLFISNSADNTKLLNFGGGITGGAAGNTVLTLSGANNGANTISGVIADGLATTLALAKSGPGTWVLNKAETYSGGTTIYGGTLQLGDLTGNGSVMGAITDNGTLAFANPNPQTVANAISGSGALKAAGAGALTLTNTNSISGVTTIKSGSTLILGDGVANNGSVGGNIIDNGSLNFANPNALAYAGSISGSGAVTVSGPGALTLSGVSTYGGSTTISATGTLNLASAVTANILPSATAVSMSGAAVFDISGVMSDQTIGSLSSASAAATVNLGLNNLITGGNGTSTTFAGSINGTGGLVKNGGGTFTLSNANTYSGGTQINAGAVQLNNANAAQNSTVTVGVANGLKFGPAVNTFNIGGLAGGSNFSLTDTASAAVTLNAGSNGADTAYSGILGGAGGVLGKAGAGTLTVSGNNTYSGGTVVSAGTLSVKTLNTALGTGAVTMAGGRLQLTGGVKNSIGINFEGGTGLAPTLLLATDTAGVYAHANWNNVNSTGVGPPPGPAGAGSNTNIDGPTAHTIVDKNGVATAMTIAFFSDHPEAVSSGAPLNTGDRKLMNGYLGVNQFFAPANHADVTLSSVPFPLYDAYVYFGGRQEFGQATTLHVTAGLNGGANPVSIYGNTNDNPFTGFVEATGVDVASANLSDYALFQLVTDATLALSVQVDQTRDAGMHGIQIVEAANPSLTYANNVVVTADSTIDVSGPSSATLGTLSIGGNTLFVTGASFRTDQPYTLNLGAATLSGNPTFDVANNGAGTGTLRVASLSTGGAARIITKANAGTLEVQGASTLTGGTSILANAGTLRFNNTSGAATIGAGVTATVAAGATLELAGSVSDLSSPAPAAARAHVINNSTSTLLVSGTHQQVGAIDGIGNTVVNAGSDLTANHIIQNALIIGGTSTSSGLVTIAASDALGNPLAQSSGLALASSLTPNGPIGSGTPSSSSPATIGSSGAGGLGLGGTANLGGSESTVPEPSTLLLFALGSLACLWPAWWKRVTR